MGELLPPDDSGGLGAIPPVSAPSVEEPYEAARLVPDAWIFRSAPSDDAAPQAEKFIFYRGSGAAVPPLAVSTTGPRIEILNHGRNPWNANAVLEVTSAGARWSPLPVLGPGTPDKPGKLNVGWTAGLVDPETVESGLGGWFHEALTARGLTSDEAAAMIATWRESWFKEEGLRVFSLVPEPWVEEILPLRIKPEPAALKRVFVARHELLAPEREEQLLAILNDPAGAGRKADFKSLALGRFAHGALERVLGIQNTRMRETFRQLRAPAGGATASLPAGF